MEVAEARNFQTEAQKTNNFGKNRKEEIGENLYEYMLCTKRQWFIG